LTVRAILHIFVEPGKLKDVGEVLAKLSEVITVNEVTGEYNTSVITGIRGRILGLRLVALYTGGKDSTLALERALEQGHEVAACLTVVPEPNSWAFHETCLEVTPLQAEAIGIPHVMARVGGGKAREVQELGIQLAALRERLGVEGFVSGAIRSSYQKSRLDELASELGLKHIAPNWGSPPGSVVKEVVKRGYEVLVSSVAAEGLGREWIGRRLDARSLEELLVLSEKHGFDPDGEGGDYETLVLWAPIFRRRIRLTEWATTWDGYSGRLVLGGMMLE
jgi:ABC transporter with metal-binding/Fe-S-binding domain ATP-binding protein